MLRRLTLALAVAVAAIAVGAGSAPKDAQAAWKYSCDVMVYNGTPVTTNIRLFTWLPFPGTLPFEPISGTPHEISAVYVAIGLEQGKFGLLLSVTGLFINGGCGGTVQYITGQGLAQCAYFNAPRTDNTISCNDPIKWVQWKDDSSDMFVVLHIGSRGPPFRRLAAAPSGVPLAKPGQDPVATTLGLQRKDLPGSGWKRTTEVEKVGTLYQLLQRGQQPSWCDEKHKGKLEPLHYGHALFTRRGGAQSAFSLVDLFLRNRGASQLFNETLSEGEVKCLARVLSVSDGTFQTHATARKLSLPGISIRRQGYRIAIKGRINDRPWSGYLDLAQLQAGAHYSLAGFFQAHAPTSAAAEQKAFAAIASRLSAKG
ncbi:MAG TPA: hypothetical protein VF895_08140 [Gaiellaceae bacterium]